MLGQRINCTVWHVTWRHINLEPSRVVLFPGERTPAQPPRLVEGALLVTTSDPSGADLCDVARSVVLASKATPAHEFSLLQVHRVGDVRGLGRVESDLAAPIDEVGAAVLVATEHHRAAIGELSKELLLARVALEEERSRAAELQNRLDSEHADTVPPPAPAVAARE